MYDSRYAVVPDGLAGLQAAISNTYFPIELQRVTLAGDVHGAIAATSLGALRMTSIQVSGPFYGHRRPASGSDARMNYVLMLLLDGGQINLEDKHHVTVGPGDIVLLNANRPLESEQSAAGTSISVSFPAPLLRSRFLEIDDWCLVPVDTSRGTASILRECILSCWRTQEGVTATCAGDVTASLIHLLAATFRDRAAAPQFESTSTGMHFLRIRDLVAANLDNPALSVDFVATNLHLSKSYLFSIMSAASTTLGHYILERRLERSREMIADPSLKHMSISDIAAAVGFQALSHFSRRFSDRYGKSPRSYRVAAHRRSELQFSAPRIVARSMQ